jgi:hypothetical protein
MKGVEPTKMMRAYSDDIKKMIYYTEELNRIDPSKKVKTIADTLRKIINENIRMKIRNKYLEMEMCRMSSELNKNQRLIRKCIQ